jgi:hypothetical protein
MQWADPLAQRVEFFPEFALYLLPGVLPGTRFERGSGARVLRLLAKQHPLRIEEAQIPLDLVHPIAIGKRRLFPQLRCPLGGTSMEFMPEVQED